MHWPTFWAALEALATAGALIVALVILFRELPKLRNELAARKVEGINFVTEQLTARDFRESVKLIKAIWKKGNNEYSQSADRCVVSALSRLDFVAKLIELDYVDKKLFFYLFADDLYPLERALTNFAQRENSRITENRATFPYGYELLKESAKFSHEATKKRQERLDKYRVA